MSWEQTASAARRVCQQVFSIAPWHPQQQHAPGWATVIGSCTRKKSCQRLSKNSSCCSEWGLLTPLPCCSEAAEFYFTSLLCKPWMGLVLWVPVEILVLTIPWCYLFFAQDSLWVQAIERAVKTLRQRTGTVPVPAPHLSWTVKWKKCRHLNSFAISKQLVPFLVTSWLPRWSGSKEKAGWPASQSNSPGKRTGTL